MKKPNTARHCLVRPQIRIAGPIDEGKFLDFQAQLDRALDQEGPIGLELTTSGGDADLGRRIGMDIIFFGEHLDREFWFIGKSIVYSSGVNILAAFPRRRRYLTRDCMLLLHQRRLNTSLDISGPMEANLQRMREAEHQLMSGIEIERDGFAKLCEGSNISLDECLDKARTAWYVRAEEALRLGFVEGLL